MTLLRFEEGQVILQAGEVGTWLGLLLSGSLVEINDDDTQKLLHRGAIVGKTALWDCTRTRELTYRGLETGLVATMLTDEVHPPLTICTSHVTGHFLA